MKSDPPDDGYAEQMQSFANSQLNGASIRFGEAKRVLIPFEMLKAHDFQLDRATQLRFGVKTSVKMATETEQSRATGCRKAATFEWKARIKQNRSMTANEGDSIKDELGEGK